MTVTITPTADRMLDLAIKVERVMESCVTDRQLQSAFRYAKLAERRLRLMRGSASSMTDVGAFATAMQTIASSRGRALHDVIPRGPTHSKARSRFWARHN